MEILIHGTKGGYKTLYPLSEISEVMYRFANDARRTDSKGNTEWELYSLAFSGEGYIFSKYKGVRDVLRQYGGFIAFSVHIPLSKKMPGSEIKNLLDELAGRYFNSYVVNGNLNGDVHEDWSFVPATANFYNGRMRQWLSHDNISSPSGSGEPAFVYYLDDTHLCKFLDFPNQDEYLPYKQIFFIGQQYKGSEENPLNALRHDPQADLTNRIDLENTKYRIRLPQYQIPDIVAEVEVRVNGYRKNSNDKMLRKDTISVTYSKRFFETVRWEGKISDPEASQYIDVADETVIVLPLSTDKMQPLTKKIQVKVEERSGKPLSEYSITATSRTGEEKRLGQAEYIPFTGSELGEQWRIDVETPDGRKDFQSIVPENNAAPIRLQPQKSIIVRFTINDENGDLLFPPYTISYKGVRTESKNGEYEFKGEDADSDIVVIVSKQGYESKDYKFCPCREPKPYISLKKSTTPPTNNKKSYYFEVDQDIATVYPSYINEKEKVDQVQPELKKKGYRFVKWEGPTKDKRKHPEYDGYYKAVFEEVWWHKFRWYLIGAATVIFVPLLILLVLFLILPSPQKSSYVYTNVTDSISSCKNKPEALRALKERWENNKPAIAQTGGKPDSTDYKLWEQGLESINDAINKSKSASTSQAPSNNSTTETTESPVTNGQTSSPVQGENTKHQEIRNNICNEFWKLYKNNRNEQDPWNDLYRKFQQYNNNAYVKFLYKITENGAAFSKFKAMAELPSNEQNNVGLNKLNKQFDNQSNEANNATKQKEDEAKEEFLKLIKRRGIKVTDLNKFKDDEKYKGTSYANYLNNINEDKDKFVEYLKTHQDEVQDINDLRNLQKKFTEYLNDNK